MYSPIKDFTEENIWTYDQAYGRMCRTILRRANLFIPTNDMYLMSDIREELYSEIEDINKILRF